MNTVLSEDEVFLVENARKLLECECSTAVIREAGSQNSNGNPERLWNAVVEAGWPGLCFPEEFGGAGGSLFELGLIYKECGRFLLPTALYSTVFAALTIVHLGDPDQKSEVLPGLVSGSQLGAVAFQEPGTFRDLDRTSTVARPAVDGDWLLEGVKSFVSNGHIADTLLVLARVEALDGPTGLGIFVVRPKVDPGIRIEPLSTFAGDRQSEVSFDRTLCRAESLLGGISRLGETSTGFERVTDIATALQCMEMVGGAEHVIDITADYVSERRQFNRPIGSFQAVQHHLANAASDIEGANLASLEALWRLSEGLQASREVSFAKAWTGRAYKDTTLIAHQLFGGIGYARDSDLHFWSGRAKATEIGFGTPDDHLERVSALMDL